MRSAGIRLATVYAMLFGASALALVLFLWWATAGLLQRQVQADIHADAQGLVERWVEGGPPALVATIQDRLSQDVDDDTLYLLVDADGRHLAGNLEHWPSGVTVTDAWYELTVQRAGTRALADVQSIGLSDGYRLLVGRDVRTRAQLRRLLTDALLWAVMLVVVLGVVGAVVVRSLFRRMLANVSATAAAIAGGDFAQRVRLSGRGDEFDRLAETINDMLDRIARLMDGVRQVSNAIAHDLRTPITRARARLEDATAHARSSDELRLAVERAVADLDGVTAVFQALLRIAEIEAGARRSAFAPLELGPLLQDLAELYGALAEERGLRLALTLPSLPLRMRGDRELVQQAVANLLDNAIKFSPAGGEVTLSAELGAPDDAGPVFGPEPEPRVAVASVRDAAGAGAGAGSGPGRAGGTGAAGGGGDDAEPRRDDAGAHRDPGSAGQDARREVAEARGRGAPRHAGSELRIVVADAGPGIPSADRARAAERFFRGEAARHTPGSGLGLALVQAVAQLHGGVLLLQDARPGLRAVLALPVSGREVFGREAAGREAATGRAGAPEPGVVGGVPGGEG